MMITVLQLKRFQKHNVDYDFQSAWKQHDPISKQYTLQNSKNVGKHKLVNGKFRVHNDIIMITIVTAAITLLYSKEKIIEDDYDILKHNSSLSQQSLESYLHVRNFSSMRISTITILRMT